MSAFFLLFSFFLFFLSSSHAESSRQLLGLLTSTGPVPPHVVDADGLRCDGRQGAGDPDELATSLARPPVEL